MFDRLAFLDRIGLKPPPSGAEGLRALQAAYMSSVPFENIDPLLGQIPSLDPADLQTKILERRRGGYCFELNALFGAALTGFGYRPTTVLGRVRNGASEGGARMHQAFTVEEAGKTWLADVGFGGPGALWPLDLGEGAPQSVPNGIYRIRSDDAAGETVVERRQGDAWHALYGFDRSPVRPIDLDGANHLAATWPKAPFGTHLMMARHGEEGRATLFNRRAQLNGSVRLLAEPGELAHVLRQSFGINLDDGTVAAIWNRIERQPTERPS